MFSFKALLLLSIIFVLATFARCDVIESSSSRLFDGKASRKMRNALSHVHSLQARKICRMRAMARGKGRLLLQCGLYSYEMMKRAISRLERVAKSERVRLGLEAPFYKTYIVEPFEPEADSTIIFLHGFGSDILAYMQRVTPILRKGSFLPGVRLVVPIAKRQFDPFFNLTAESWFKIPRDTTSWERDDIFAAAGNVAATMDTTSALLGTSRARAGIAGFSQGGGMAVSVYLRHGVAAAGAMSGFVADVTAYPQHMTTLSADKKFFMVSGENDAIIPIQLARQSVHVLRALGRDVTYTELAGKPHNLGDKNEESWERIMRFVHREIKKNAGGKGNKKVSVPKLDIKPTIWELK